MDYIDDYKIVRFQMSDCQRASCASNCTAFTVTVHLLHRPGFFSLHRVKVIDVFQQDFMPKIVIDKCSQARVAVHKELPVNMFEVKQQQSQD